MNFIIGCMKIAITLSIVYFFFNIINGMVKGIFTAIFEFITDKLNKRD